MNIAPIALFVYKRLWHTQQTAEALKKNELAEKSELFIFSDAPKNDKEIESVTEVRKYKKTITGFKKIIIIERDVNFGLAKSIITGVTEIINQYGRIIVLEDDLVSSPYFLRYMNEALEFYAGNDRIFSITGYNFPITIPANYKQGVYFGYRCMSWGWGTWVNRWNLVEWEINDFELFIKDDVKKKNFNRGGEDLSYMLEAQMKGNIESWAIRWCYAHYKNNALCVYPVKTLIRNIGFDGSGVHCGKSNKFESILSDMKLDELLLFPKQVELKETIIKEVYSLHKTNLIIKMMIIIKNLFK